jgi:hypothetical protein
MLVHGLCLHFLYSLDDLWQHLPLFRGCYGLQKFFELGFFSLGSHDDYDFYWILTLPIYVYPLLFATLPVYIGLSFSRNDGAGSRQDTLQRCHQDIDENDFWQCIGQERYDFMRYLLDGLCGNR